LKKTAYLLFLIPLIFSGIISCNSKSSLSLDENTVREYADPATENTLQGLSENDLEKYVQYGNAAFKKGLTQQSIDTTSAQMNSQFGGFRSIEFLSLEEQNGYIFVHYKAIYDIGEIGVKMVFDKDHRIASLWFE
jgi:hypothetical protein